MARAAFATLTPAAILANSMHRSLKYGGPLISLRELRRYGFEHAARAGRGGEIALGGGPRENLGSIRLPRWGLVRLGALLAAGRRLHIEAATGTQRSCLIGA